MKITTVVFFFWALAVQILVVVGCWFGDDIRKKGDVGFIGVVGVVRVVGVAHKAGNGYS